MGNKRSIQKIKSEIEKGMGLKKCRGCGCMKETLEKLLLYLPLIGSDESVDLIKDIKIWLNKMEDIKYSCLGCEYCYPAVAMNILGSEFPHIQMSSPDCSFEIREEEWPPVPGEYFAFCKGSTCPVAVSTLASVQLAETLADIRPDGLCIVGKTETENIGIDKVIKNTITNPTIRFLILTGKDSKGHQSGKTLLMLWRNGIDKNRRVIGSPGKRPILKNVSLSEVEFFRKQVQVIDMIGCEDAEKIVDKINELSKNISTCECEECTERISIQKISSVPRVLASKPKKLRMDRAGYFVVIPVAKKNTIVVEHYSYDNKLLHIIEGKEAVSIYSTIIENGWVTELTHAAYLGRELTKAEFSLKYGFRYVQDKAPEPEKKG